MSKLYVWVCMLEHGACKSGVSVTCVTGVDLSHLCQKKPSHKVVVRTNAF